MERTLVNSTMAFHTRIAQLHQERGVAAESLECGHRQSRIGLAAAEAQLPQIQ